MFEGIERVGFSILASWAGSPSNKNSVLEGLRDRKLEAIQLEISEMESCKSLIFSEKLTAEKERKS